MSFAVRKFWRIGAIVLACALVGGAAMAQGADSLEQRIAKIMARPEYRYTSFGIEFYSLDTGKPVYQLDAGKLYYSGFHYEIIDGGNGAGIARRGFSFSYEGISHWAN